MFSSHENGAVVVRLSGEDWQLVDSMVRALGVVKDAHKVILDLRQCGLLGEDAIGKLVHTPPHNHGAIVVTSASMRKLESLALTGPRSAAVQAAFRWEVLDTLPEAALGPQQAAQSSALQEAFLAAQQQASMAAETSLSALHFPATGTPAAFEHRESGGMVSIVATKPATRSDDYAPLLAAIRDLPLDKPCSVDISAIDCHGRQVAPLILLACRGRLAKGGSPLEILPGPTARLLLRPEMGPKLGFKVT